MNQRFMREKPILPLLLSMALPMVVSMLVNSLYNIIDSLFVAKIGEDAITALSLVYPVQNLINALAIGFGVGINAVISYHLGAGETDKADAAATRGIACSVIHGVVSMIVCITVMPRFLRLFTDSEQVAEMGTQYASIAFAFSVIIMVGLAFEKIYQAMGRMQVTMTALLLGCVTNIVLDPLFIFGIGPFPQLGMRGAALATASPAGNAGVLSGDISTAAGVRAYHTQGAARYSRHHGTAVCDRHSGGTQSGAAVIAHLVSECAAG